MLQAVKRPTHSFGHGLKQKRYCNKYVRKRTVAIPPLLDLFRMASCTTYHAWGTTPGLLRTYTANVFSCAAIYCILLFLSTQSLVAQKDNTKTRSDPGVIFTADTKLVVLHTSVTDNEQHFVTELPQETFRIYEDDVLQTIKIFHREDVPVSLGILVDNSGSMRDKRQKVNAAAVNFVKASNPDDEVFIVNFNDEAFLDSDFTSDIKRMQDALQQIDARGGTALYDATNMSLDHLQEKSKWDKQVLLIVTDGEDNASLVELEELIRRLEETDTVIYAVGLLSEEDRGSAKRASRAIRYIVQATGGVAFFPANVNEVNALIHQIAQDIRNQYILAYSPSQASPRGFRNVKVELFGKGTKRFKVRHRPGYYF